MVERHQSETDGLGLPRPMWWLWPFLALLLVIWVISLWAVRVAETETVLGVVTTHRGLGSTARAELSVLIPQAVAARPLGEAVSLDCPAHQLKAQVFAEPGEILSVQDIRDLVGSRLLAERLFADGVRVQSVVTDAEDSIPAPGEHCGVTLLSGQARLLELLGRRLDS